MEAVEDPGVGVGASVGKAGIVGTGVDDGVDDTVVGSGLVTVDALWVVSFAP